MTWFDQESIWRDRGFYTYCLIPIIIVIIIMGSFMFYSNDYFNKKIAENQAKSKAELTSINNMNCQQLHDKLLNTDRFFDSDNEAIARDHYVAQCGVRLP